MVEEHSAINLAARQDPEFVVSPLSPPSSGISTKEPSSSSELNKLPNQPTSTNEGTSSTRKSQTTNTKETSDKTSVNTKQTTEPKNQTKDPSPSGRANENEISAKSDSDNAQIDTESSGKTDNIGVMTVEDAISPLRDDKTEGPRDSDSPKPGCSTQQDVGGDSTSPRSPRSADSVRDRDVFPAMLATSPFEMSSVAIRRLRMENERLQAEVTRLRRLVVSGASTVLNERKFSEDTGDVPPAVKSLEAELFLAKEAIIALKQDRKRLKAEKFDLLDQMKQLYATLEDKEKELRDFIRNYEQRVRENETSLQQLSTEREERERERWSLLRHARDEAERSLSLAAQLNAKELQLQQAQEQLQEARRQLASSGCVSDQESLVSLPRHSANGGAVTPGSGGILSGHQSLGLLPGDRGSCSADSGVRVSSDRESGATSVGGNLSDSTTEGTPTITVEGRNMDPDSTSLVSSIPPPHMYQSICTSKDTSLSPLNAKNFSRASESNVLSRSEEQLNSAIESDRPNSISRRPKIQPSRLGSGRGGTWGSISRVFARSRHRNKTSYSQDNNDSNYDPYRSWSPLTEEGYAEKLRLLREASSIPMERWKAPTVLAWLEIALGMPQYGARCAENIKSGKMRDLHGQVLLELSDLELECGLGIAHPMHRKKLRLAIEEHRHPALVRYPCIAQLGHTWVSSEWLPDLGLSQYSESFAANLVDARMLEHLSKKELEKYLGVTRKFHQASIVHGIHLLRIIKYDRQALAVRRHQCENVDADPLVWTNQRFIRWARNIDLGEYADNLKDSGVHGGLVVLEPSFNGDTMATALGIPASKNIIRRHLTAELEALILPARSTLEHYVRVRSKPRAPGGSLGRSFSKSCVGLTSANADSCRTSLKGSLSRALGLTKAKSEKECDKHSPTSSSGSSSVISHISPPPRSVRSFHSGDESPIYAIPFAHNIAPNNPQQPSNTTYGVIYQPIREVTNMRTFGGENRSENIKVKSLIDSSGTLPERRQHRRVRSIGSTDAFHTSLL
ncbi:kazrin isoform X3 [Agrilus planipennis]|nr:kazrin isoform X3 [Agrilus planipennis]